MSTIVTIRAGPHLLQPWRRQVARQRRKRAARGPRPWAAISYLVRGPLYDGLIDVRRVLFLVLRDEQRINGSVTTSFAGYTAMAVPWGVQIGGAENNRFHKHLTLVPRLGPGGPRFDLADQELLTAALDLDRYLERHARHPHLPRRRQVRWPQLWGAFEPEIAQGIHPDCDASLSPGVTSLTRTILGLKLFPLDLVSHAWERFTTVFADLRTLPKRQIVGLEHQARNLCGYDGAIEYDLLNSRFAPAQVTAAS